MRDGIKGDSVLPTVGEGHKLCGAVDSTLRRPGLAQSPAFDPSSGWLQFIPINVSPCKILLTSHKYGFGQIMDSYNGRKVF